MDALALLNALDVIRNEKTYQERLNSIADAQAKLDTSGYIVETVEIANARLEEANRLLEQYRKQISMATEEISKLRVEKLKDLDAREITVAKKELSAAASFKQIKEQLEVMEIERQKLVDLQKQLAVKNEDIQKHLQESTDIRNTYIRKINELKHIVNN